MTIGCLSLNASYEPLTVVPMRRALMLIARGVVEVLEEDPERPIRSGSQSIPFPTVIRLKRMIHVPDRFRTRVSNTFLFARDNYTCQYCSIPQDKLRGRNNVLTRDHIIPISRGGTDTWNNVTTACTKCNSKKDNKTLEESGMKLLRKPFVPHMVHLKWQIRRLTDMQRKYVQMFYGNDWVLYVDK